MAETEAQRKTRETYEYRRRVELELLMGRGLTETEARDQLLARNLREKEIGR